MKKFSVFLIVLLSAVLTVSAQIHDPVKWVFSSEKTSDGFTEITLKATIEDKWHLYSQDIPDGGPRPTFFDFFKAEQFTTEGVVREGKPIEEYDKNFEMTLKYYGHEAIFKQKIRVNTNEAFQLKGELEYMVCDDSQCLPPEWVDIVLEIPAGSITPTDAVPVFDKINYGASSHSGDKVHKEKSDNHNTTIENAEPDDEKKSHWGIFFIAFLSGFAALLTPCVFPMIPMTVSFFTKQSKTKTEGIRNAIIYGLSIIVIYVILGVVVTAIFGADALHALSTDPYFNIFFFVLLVVFACSFLGAFEITLPTSWINKADKGADKGGMIGIFFMAFTLALVSFSCTGPIVGTLLVEAASGGDQMGPIIGMFGFSLAIALPFALFAAFPGWLNSLPQSGGWLNSVKVVLGFLELALAFKFLSNADLVTQSHLLEREVFISIWIIIFGLLTMYLLGKIKLPHDSDLKFIPVSRLMLAITTGVFTVYMIPGLWGAPLKIISAFPPPLNYSESPNGVGGAGSSMHGPEGTHPGPQGIPTFHDYEKGLAYAKSVGKPVFLDFTGHACVNCRKMEQSVWSDPQIKAKLLNDVVLISLYVDEDIALPEEEQQVVVLTGGKKKKIKTVGQKWAAFQEMKYKTNSQPYYVILDHNENQINEAANYQDFKEIMVFDKWLKEGIADFKKTK